MARDAVKWLLIASFTIGITTAAWAQDADIGRSLYQSSCAICHGIDGKGKGLFSAQLKSTPPDLTVLTKKNNGVFPANTVYEIIDGRTSIGAHGTREMPIWGYAFLSFGPEYVIRNRILAIIDYLNRIQEK